MRDSWSVAHWKRDEKLVFVLRRLDDRIGGARFVAGLPLADPTGWNGMFFSKSREDLGSQRRDASCWRLVMERKNPFGSVLFPCPHGARTRSCQSGFCVLRELVPNLKLRLALSP